MQDKIQLMDKQAMARAIARIAHEIVERNQGVADVALIGIMRRGVPIAQRIADNIESFEGKRVPVGILDIALYRDDLSTFPQPLTKPSAIGFPVQDKHIVMVDDVLFTGRTARAAMDGIIAMGRPNSIQFAVLIDRGHRELPIKADYVGKNVPTSKREAVEVRFFESGDNAEEIVLQELD